MGAIRDFLDSVGRTKTGYTGVNIPGPPPADTASAADKAAFDESVRKYQLDRRAYEQYNTELNNRLRAFNPYADSQYRVASTTPPAGATSVSVPTAPAPTAPTQLRAPTYGAISQFSNLTPQQQGDLYLQQRGIGYTDADIRKATAAQVGTPSEEMMAGIYKTAYPQYTQAIESQYGTQFNRSGYGTGAGQIDYPGFNYYINQLSTGAVTPDTLESAIRGGAAATPVTTPGTTAPASDINALYQQYFNRQADPGGLQYWQQSGLTGDALRNAIIAGAQGPDLDYYNSVYNRPNDYGHSAARGGYISKYADGGRVRTHYQTGGMADEGNLDEIDAFYRDPRNFTRPTPLGPARTYQEMMRAAMPTVGPVRGLPIPGETIAIGEGGTLQPMSGEPSMPMVAGAPAVEPNPAEAVGDPIQAAAAPAAPRQPSIQDLLARYGGGSGEGSRELAGARQRYQSEANAFSDMIRQMSERAESPTSRAEMYFRLAAAFGSPTRTGSMSETLGKVGEQMGEYTKGRRAEEAERRGLMLRAQEARLAGAREDLQTTRALSAQEASERRALTSAALQEYIRSGRPQSRAGQLALDAGLTPGTPAFQEFVRRNAELDVERTTQMMTAQAEILRLRTEAADRLSPTEIKMAEETMQNVAAGRDNLSALRRALELNESSSPDNLTQGTITRLRAAFGSEAPIVVNTRELNNILDRLTLSSLKETFPGAISNDERTALRAVQGIGAKSLEERRRIIRNAIESLERVVPRNEEHFRNVRSGSFGRIER